MQRWDGLNHGAAIVVRASTGREGGKHQRVRIKRALGSGQRVFQRKGRWVFAPQTFTALVRRSSPRRSYPSRNTSTTLQEDEALNSTWGRTFETAVCTACIYQYVSSCRPIFSNLSLDAPPPPSGQQNNKMGIYYCAGTFS